MQAVLWGCFFYTQKQTRIRGGEAWQEHQTKNWRKLRHYIAKA